MTGTRIAVIGGSGQVARALVRRADATGADIVAGGRPKVDITDPRGIAAFLYETQPAIVINAAAYTAVDRAEQEPEAAFAVNAEAPARLAVLCATARVPLVHLSTDYVFDGMKGAPYLESDPPSPLGTYGASKAAGEDAVRSGTPWHVIVRTSWVYDADGQNFLNTMLRLGEERNLVRVVDDQHGAPTSADDLAAAVLEMARQVLSAAPHAPWGTYHITGGGATTWHGFAREIFRLAALAGRRVPALEAIPTRAYPTPAKRPADSRLDTSKARDTFGISLPRWDASLAATLGQIFSRATSGSQGMRP